jgi:hypothetical protein
MHWVNRPTTQGIAMFGRIPASAPPPAAVAPATLPSTGAAPPVGLGVLLLIAAGVLLLSRRAMRAGIGATCWHCIPPYS